MLPHRSGPSAPGVAALALCLLAVAGCGDDRPAGSSSTAPSARASDGATATGQPAGPDGVTVELANYAAYDDEPAVLAWKKTIEAVQASGNLRQVLPRVSDDVAPPLRRQIVAGLKQAWSNQWNVRPVVSARVASLTGGADDKRLVACIWGPSYGYYDSGGRYVGEAQDYWLKIAFDLAPQGRDWMIEQAKQTGTCPGGAPQ